jgi:hypothetical protein
VVSGCSALERVAVVMWRRKSREVVDLLEVCTGDATLEDMVVLFCVHIKKFIIDMCIGLGCLRRGEGRLEIVVRW